jgi:hypothetical protein
MCSCRRSQTRSSQPRPAKALDPATLTGLVACDISAELARRFAATTPFVLARYARIVPASV